MRSGESVRKPTRNIHAKNNTKHSKHKQHEKAPQLDSIRSQSEAVYRHWDKLLLFFSQRCLSSNFGCVRELTHSHETQLDKAHGRETTDNANGAASTVPEYMERK
jgi:hypothetical protein